METKPITDEKKIKILSFLRHLFSELNQTAKSFSLTQKCYEYGLPYYTVISVKLVEMEYLIKTGSTTNVKYLWNKDCSPTMTEVERICEAVIEYNKSLPSKKKNSLIDGISSDELNTVKIKETSEVSDEQKPKRKYTKRNKQSNQTQSDETQPIHAESFSVKDLSEKIYKKDNSEIELKQISNIELKDSIENVVSFCRENCLYFDIRISNVKFESIIVNSNINEN